MYVITNHENRNGAIGVLNSAIMDYAAEKLGDFYILPASIHEVLLVVKDSELDAESLQPEKTIYVRSVSHRAKCRVEAVEEINENTQKF